MGKLGKGKRPKFPGPKKKNFITSQEINQLTAQYDSIDPATIKTFWDFPLSEKTRKGLKDCFYKTPTEIQREAIGFGLAGKDILGAAETGSGKTLAFIIPVLESLYIKKWTRMDGLGAMIITPTRELAYQIFETLKKVGQHHDFSAGLIIGGKDLHFEKDRMDQCNIVICTPGRILNHMDINPVFDCSSLQILVLDEADRCLDMGFEKTMNSIIENLPATRQTLLFSATQTKSVKDLARLSLKTPVYVSVHENKKHTTPDALEQSYIVCPLEAKLNFLWSFIKNHRRQKILIFLSSCKQVKYVYTLFCRLRPGTPLLGLYGTLHQLRRMKIYNEFCSKQNVVMFATDIAARGLDFPHINWVVQLDCPEDANTYIHRAGRTARFSRGGESLLVLLPSEEQAMIEELESKRVPIAKIEVNHAKMMSPIRQIEALLARDPELKADAQRCFLAYIKSIHLMKNKDIFSVEALDLGKFAASLGLAVTPRIRFLKDKIKKSGPDKSINFEDDTSDEEKLTGKAENVRAFHANLDAADEIITLKREDHDLPEDFLPIDNLLPPPSKKQLKKAVVTKAAAAKKILKKNIVANKKTVFTEEGEVIELKGREKFTEEAKQYENENAPGIDIARAKLILRAEDKFDKKLFRERVKQKHKAQKNKLKEKMGDKEDEEEDDDEEVEVRLASGSDSGESEPDTSWIPDPDKFSRQGESDSSEAEENDVVEENRESRKRKAPQHKSAAKKNRDNGNDKHSSYNTGLSLEEDEEIALRILQLTR